MQKASRDLVWLSLQSKTDFSCPATNIFTVLIRRTMKLLHSGFFFFLFYCARVQPVHTWRINSTKMQRLRKTVFAAKKWARPKSFSKPIQMWPMQMKPLQIYSRQMYPVKSANANIGSKCKYEMTKGVSCR